MGSITNQKFIYDAVVPILHRNTTDFLPEMTMNTATITQAQTKTLRQHIADTLGKIRQFAIELYEAHGGLIVPDAAQPGSGALARRKMQQQAGIIILGPFCAAALAPEAVRETPNNQ
jgi:hypothetical protein